MGTCSLWDCLGCHFPFLHSAGTLHKQAHTSPTTWQPLHSVCVCVCLAVSLSPSLPLLSPIYLSILSLSFLSSLSINKQTNIFVYVCQSVHSVCVCEYEYMCATAHVWESKDNLKCYPHLPHCSKPGLIFVFSPMSFQGFSLLSLPPIPLMEHWGYKCTLGLQTNTVEFYFTWILNPGPHAHRASTLSMCCLPSPLWDFSKNILVAQLCSSGACMLHRWQCSSLCQRLDIPDTNTSAGPS